MDPTSTSPQPPPEREHIVYNKEAIVLEQYAACASILRELFRYCPDTTWHVDGVGCCTYDGRADDYLATLVSNWAGKRHDRRQTAHPERWELHVRPACHYHQPNVGCTLGDLMAPVCLGFTHSCVDLPDSFERLGDVTHFLNEVLRGNPGEIGQDGCFGAPEKSWSRVQVWIAIAKEVVADARRAFFAKSGEPTQN